MNAGANAAIFYLSVIALVGGVIRALCASIERRARDRMGVTLALCGAAGLIVAIAVFVTGSKTQLPF